MAHLHQVRDTDTHFIIDPVTRAVTNANEVKNRIFRGDHNSEIFTFELPRYIDSHDMSQCDTVEIHFINTGSGGTFKSFYTVKDLAVAEDEPDKIMFSWTLFKETSQYVGTLNFAIHFACTTGEVNDYVWNTAIHTGVQVKDTIYNTDEIYETSIDVLEQWKKELLAEIGEVSGASSYADLTGKPTLNGVEISGNKTAADYGVKPADFVVTITDSDSNKLLSDKTYDEIKTAIDAGSTVYAIYSDTTYPFDEDTVMFIAFANTGIQGIDSIMIWKNGNVAKLSKVYSASSNTYGVVKANPATEEDTVPVNIDSDGFLKVSAKPKDFIINVTVKSGSLVADKTNAEIYQAYNEGRTLKVIAVGISYELDPSVSIVTETQAIFSKYTPEGMSFSRINIINDKVTISTQTLLAGKYAGGIKAHSATAEDTLPVNIDEDGFLHADVKISEKTEGDTDYTVEVKIDPVTRKLYVPSSIIQNSEGGN